MRRITIAVAVTFIACHRSTPGELPVRNQSVIGSFRDTVPAIVLSSGGQEFKLSTPAERAALRRVINRERGLWQSIKPADYKYLLRVGCFCPGPRGWQLIEVRDGRLVRAWDSTGRPVELTDWNTITIDRLFEVLDRAVDTNLAVRVAFEARWHFPTFIYTSGPRTPDGWSTFEARAPRNF